jgi:hypothetical protein
MLIHTPRGAERAIGGLAQTALPAGHLPYVAWPYARPLTSNRAEERRNARQLVGGIVYLSTWTSA